MTGSETVANWQEVLRCHSELCHMGLGRQVVFEEMPDLCLVDSLGLFFADADLDGINAILVHGFDLCDLASIELDYCARDYASPVVPEVSHTDLDSEDTGSLTVTADWLDHL